VKVGKNIKGAYKATLSPVLNIELYLLLIKQQIWKMSTKIVSRILSLNKMPTLAGS
jgi:hypothetical protein